MAAASGIPTPSPTPRPTASAFLLPLSPPLSLPLPVLADFVAVDVAVAEDVLVLVWDRGICARMVGIEVPKTKIADEFWQHS